jgi:hypothetical protein
MDWLEHSEGNQFIKRLEKQQEKGNQKCPSHSLQNKTHNNQNFNS